MSARLVIAIGALIPALAGGLEPRYDHRYMQGPQVELLVARDFAWSGLGATTTSSGVRKAVRVAWGFDPTGEGDEVLLGGAFTVADWRASEGDAVLIGLDARYRAYAGTEELKTFFDLGVWGSAKASLAVGPLVGLGLTYDFSRNLGVFTSGYLAGGLGESRLASFGVGVGLHVRYE